MDGRGNFMGSTIVRLKVGDPAPQSLALSSGLAVYEAVSATLNETDGLMLKWPNDLLLNGAKLAGILLEMENDAVIVGIGVNLADAPVIEGRPTIAVANMAQSPGRDAFAALLAERFSDELDRWRNFGLQAMLSRWKSAAHPEGTKLTVQEPGSKPLHGQFAGLDPAGALRLRLADGSSRVIHAADVTT